VTLSDAGGCASFAGTYPLAWNNLGQYWLYTFFSGGGSIRLSCIGTTWNLQIECGNNSGGASGDATTVNCDPSSFKLTFPTLTFPAGATCCGSGGSVNATVTL